MPAASANASGAQALIGPPPPSIPAFAMGSFLLMAGILYYLFFRFTFAYDYDGTLMVRRANPQQLIVTIAKGQNLAGSRTSKWRATVQPLQGSPGAVITHSFGARGGEIKHNEFSISTPQPLLNLPVGVPVACRVRLTSAPLVEKLLQHNIPQ